jgi:hypothetical protein
MITLVASETVTPAYPTSHGKLFTNGTPAFGEAHVKTPARA